MANQQTRTTPLPDLDSFEVGQLYTAPDGTCWRKARVPAWIPAEDAPEGDKPAPAEPAPAKPKSRK